MKFLGLTLYTFNKIHVEPISQFINVILIAATVLMYVPFISPTDPSPLSSLPLSGLLTFRFSYPNFVAAPSTVIAVTVTIAIVGTVCLRIITTTTKTHQLTAVVTLVRLILSVFCTCGYIHLLRLYIPWAAVGLDGRLVLDDTVAVFASIPAAVACVCAALMVPTLVTFSFFYFYVYCRFMLDSRYVWARLPGSVVSYNVFGLTLITTVDTLLRDSPLTLYCTTAAVALHASVVIVVQQPFFRPGTNRVMAGLLLTACGACGMAACQEVAVRRPALWAVLGLYIAVLPVLYGVGSCASFLVFRSAVLKAYGLMEPLRKSRPFMFPVTHRHRMGRMVCVDAKELVHPRLFSVRRDRVTGPVLDLLGDLAARPRQLVFAVMAFLRHGSAVQTAAPYLMAAAHRELSSTELTIGVRWFVQSLSQQRPVLSGSDVGKRVDRRVEASGHAMAAVTELLGRYAAHRPGDPFHQLVLLMCEIALTEGQSRVVPDDVAAVMGTLARTAPSMRLADAVLFEALTAMAHAVRRPGGACDKDGCDRALVTQATDAIGSLRASVDDMLQVAASMGSVHSDAVSAVAARCEELGPRFIHAEEVVRLLGPRLPELDGVLDAVKRLTAIRLQIARVQTRAAWAAVTRVAHGATPPHSRARRDSDPVAPQAPIAPVPTLAAAVRALARDRQHLAALGGLGGTFLVTAAFALVADVHLHSVHGTAMAMVGTVHARSTLALDTQRYILSALGLTFTATDKALQQVVLQARVDDVLSRYRTDVSSVSGSWAFPHASNAIMEYSGAGAAPYEAAIVSTAVSVKALLRLDTGGDFTPAQVGAVLQGIAHDPTLPDNALARALVADMRFNVALLAYGGMFLTLVALAAAVMVWPFLKTADLIQARRHVALNFFASVPHCAIAPKPADDDRDDPRPTPSSFLTRLAPTPSPHPPHPAPAGPIRRATHWLMSQLTFAACGSAVMAGPLVLAGLALVAHVWTVGDSTIDATRANVRLEAETTLVALTTVHSALLSAAGHVTGSDVRAGVVNAFLTPDVGLVPLVTAIHTAGRPALLPTVPHVAEVIAGQRHLARIAVCLAMQVHFGRVDAVCGDYDVDVDLAHGSAPILTEPIGYTTFIADQAMTDDAKRAAAQAIVSRMYIRVGEARLGAMMADLWDVVSTIDTARAQGWPLAVACIVASVLVGLTLLLIVAVEERRRATVGSTRSPSLALPYRRVASALSSTYLLLVIAALLVVASHHLVDVPVEATPGRSGAALMSSITAHLVEGVGRVAAFAQQPSGGLIVDIDAWLTSIAPVEHKYISDVADGPYAAFIAASAPAAPTSVSLLLDALDADLGDVAAEVGARIVLLGRTLRVAARLAGSTIPGHCGSAVAASVCGYDWSTPAEPRLSASLMVRCDVLTACPALALTTATDDLNLPAADRTRLASEALVTASALAAEVGQLAGPFPTPPIRQPLLPALHPPSPTGVTIAVAGLLFAATVSFAAATVRIALGRADRAVTVRFGAYTTSAPTLDDTRHDSPVGSSGSDSTDSRLTDPTPGVVLDGQVPRGRLDGVRVDGPIPASGMAREGRIRAVPRVKTTILCLFALMVCVTTSPTVLLLGLSASAASEVQDAVALEATMSNMQHVTLQALRSLVADDRFASAANCRVALERLTLTAEPAPRPAGRAAIRWAIDLIAPMWQQARLTDWPAFPTERGGNSLVEAQLVQAQQVSVMLAAQRVVQGTGLLDLLEVLPVDRTLPMAYLLPDAAAISLVGVLDEWADILWSVVNVNYQKAPLTTLIDHPILTAHAFLEQAWQQMSVPAPTPLPGLDSTAGRLALPVFFLLAFGGFVALALAVLFVLRGLKKEDYTSYLLLAVLPARAFNMSALIPVRGRD